MCLAIPGKIVKVDGKQAEIDYGGIRKQARMDFLDAKPGDYVMVHAGFAIEKLRVEDAKKTLEALKHAGLG